MGGLATGGGLIYAVFPALAGLCLELYQQQLKQKRAYGAQLLAQLDYSRLQQNELNEVYTGWQALGASYETQMDNLAALRAAIIQISTQINEAAILQDLTTAITEIIGFERALVLLYQSDQALLSFAAISEAPPQAELRAKLQAFRLEFNPQDPVLSQDPLLGPWVLGQSLEVSGPAFYQDSRLHGLLSLLDFGAFYSVPLLVGPRFLGVMLADKALSGQDFSDENRALLESLSTTIAVTLENARLYTRQDAQLQEKLEEVRQIQRIDRELVDTLNLDQVTELILDWALRFTNARFAAITLQDEGGKSVRIAAAYGCEPALLPQGDLNRPIPLSGIGITGRAIRNSKTQHVLRAAQDPDYLQILPGIQAHLSVPILRRRRVLGALTLETEDEKGFSPAQIGFVEGLGYRAGVALENARLFTESQTERNKLSAILNSTADAVVVVNSEQDLVLLNESARVIFDLADSIESYLGRPYQQVLRDPNLVSFYYSLYTDTPLTQIVLNERSYQAMAVLVEGVGQVMVLHDITPFKELDNMKNQFVASVSHDLKTPLAIIRGYTDMLEMTQNINEKGLTYMERINQAIDNMRELIDNLLDLAKIESGLKLKLAPVTLADLVMEVQDDLLFRAKDKGLKFHNNLTHHTPMVTADPARLRQILQNLVGNAVKYTLEAGTVTVEAIPEGDYLRINIKDQGIGIAPEDLKRLFKRFERIRTEKTKDIEGTGLGLTIVKLLVEAHGGQVGVESEVGVGSTFWFSLPLFTKSPVPELHPLETA
jgi:signal transduction histidine kinase